MRLVFVGTTTGRQGVLLDTPVGRLSVGRLAWAPDSRSVAFADVYLPLGGSDEDLAIRRSHLFAVEVNVPTLDWKTITREELTLVEWQSKPNRLVFSPGRATMRPQNVASVFFSKENAEWKKGAADIERRRPEIILDEGPNAPPKIVLLDSKTGEGQLLYDLNPQFEGLRFSRVEEVKWSASPNHEVKGGLYYPVNYLPGRRYPLVIQTHGWNPHRFWIDGAFPAPFAAQALAGRDIVVLQADEDYSDMGTTKEVDREVAALKGAIDFLDEKGLIDRNRVGVIGFSRTGLYVRFALTHWQYRFAAASLTDDFSGGYFPYIAFSLGNTSWARSSEGPNGGLPFGGCLHSWIERSPGFNLHNVQTPVRLVALHPASLLGEWEWFSALRRLDRPVQLVYLQDSDHVSQRPSYRLASQAGNVDLFGFWLKDEIVSGPAQAEQYKRWEKWKTAIPPGH